MLVIVLPPYKHNNICSPLALLLHCLGMVTDIATHAKEPVSEATAFEIRFKLSMDISRQTHTKRKLAGFVDEVGQGSQY